MARSALWAATFKGWALLVYYKGHVIMVLYDDVLTAEITERATAAPLPTKVSASLEEGFERVIQRAKALVDLYTDPPPK